MGGPVQLRCGSRVDVLYQQWREALTCPRFRDLTATADSRTAADGEMGILRLYVILLLLMWSCLYGCAERRSSLLHARLVNMLSLRNRLRTIPRRGRRGDSFFNNANARWECCPSYTNKTAPMGGISRSQTILELYRDPLTTQYFYDTKCYPRIRNNHCNYIDARIRKLSICLQKYTYVYAIVRDHGSNQPYRVDYIKMRAGCKCQISQGRY